MGCGSSTSEHPPSTIQDDKHLLDNKKHRKVRPGFGLRDPCKKQVIEYVPDHKDVTPGDKQPPPPDYNENPENEVEDDMKTEVAETIADKDHLRDDLASLVSEKEEEEEDVRDEAPAPPAPLIRSEEDVERVEVVVGEEEEIEEIGGNSDEESATFVNTDKTMGRIITTFDFREEKTFPPQRTRPVVPPGELWVDEEFSLEVALQGLGQDFYDKQNMEYRRPKDLVPEPVLYDGTPSRFDIEQGRVGTCYFLSVLQSMAEKPEFMNQVLPEGSYRIGTPEYDGVFHCRFWRFGHWEDVFIDDQIPSYPNTYWGAHNKDPNHLWVALMEKAFAKFHGSYQGCWSGNTSYAFITMTGGMSEFLDQAQMAASKNLRTRMKNALNCGAVVACSVPNNNDSKNGLVGNHAYSVTALCKVPYQSKMVSLIRIRNPWGSAKGEWTGAWSDGAPQWNDVPDDIKQTLEVKSEGDGEFWMTTKDYMKSFTSTTICNFTPDADGDGDADQLDKEHLIRGKWTDEELGDFETRLYAQKFVFEIPKSGGEGVPVVIQLIQQLENRNSRDFLGLRADLFKIDADVSNNKDGPCMLLCEVTNQTTFMIAESVTYRYMHLLPGKYMVLPHYIKGKGAQREFITRIFCPINLKVNVINERRCFMDTVNDGTWQDPSNNKLVTMPLCQTFYGQWVSGSNAGGQIGHKSHHTNPQYHFTVTGKGAKGGQLAKVTLVQEDANALAIGFMLMDVSQGAQVPMTYEWIVMNKKQHCVKDVTGADIKFVMGGEVSSVYKLPPGKYMLIIFTDKPNDPRKYFLQLNSQTPVKVKEYNVCK